MSRTCSFYAVPVSYKLCLFLICCACSYYAVPVPNSLYLFLIRCASSYYAVLDPNRLCLFLLSLTCSYYSAQLFVVPVPIWNSKDKLLGCKCLYQWKNKFISSSIFFSGSMVTNLAILLVLRTVCIFLSLPTVNGNTFVSRQVHPHLHCHFS